MTSQKAGKDAEKLGHPNITSGGEMLQALWKVALWSPAMIRTDALMWQHHKQELDILDLIISPSLHSLSLQVNNE